MCSEERQGIFFFNDTATTEIYTLSLHDALPISWMRPSRSSATAPRVTLSRPCASARKCSLRSETHLTGRPTAFAARSEEHTSELQSRQYLVCRLLLEKKTTYPSSTSSPPILPVT